MGGSSSFRGDIDPHQFEPTEVKFPLFPASFHPEVPDQFQVLFGMGFGPIIDLSEVFHDFFSLIIHPCQSQVFRLMAEGAEGDESIEALGEGEVVVVPDFVAFDGPGWASSSADLAGVISLSVC